MNGKGLILVRLVDMFPLTGKFGRYVSVNELTSKPFSQAMWSAFACYRVNSAFMRGLGLSVKICICVFPLYNLG